MLDNFNLNNWPLVYYTNTSNSFINDEIFEEFKEYYLNLLLRCKRNKEKMTLICNLNNLSENSPSLKYVMKFAQFNKTIYKFNKEYVNGVVLLSSNKCLKDLLNMFFTVSKPACPVKMCRSKEKMIKFLKDKCNYIYNINLDIDIDNNDTASPVDDDNNDYYESNNSNIDDNTANSFIETESYKQKYSALL